MKRLVVKTPQVTRQQVVEENAILATEMRLVASFFVGDGLERELPFFPQRQLKGLTWASMRSPLARAAWKAVEVCTEQETPTTIANVAATIIAERYQSDTDDLTLDLRVIVEHLKFYAESGATTLSQFHRLEILHYNRLRQDASGHFIAAATAIMGQADGRTNTEKLFEIQELLKETLGGFSNNPKSLTPDGQLALLEAMPGEMQALVGKALPYVPGHLGKIAQVMRFMQKGEMGVISGPTGSGKSTLIWTIGEANAYFNQQRVLGLLLEDDQRTVMRRACCRWTADTTYQELLDGDVRGRLATFSAKLREWYANGGYIQYEEKPGLGGTELIQFLRGMLEEAIARERPYDIVILDYFQKVDFGRDAIAHGGNAVLAAEWIAEQLRIVAQTYNVVMIVASQITPGENGKNHIAWSKALGHKSQWHLTFSRNIAQEDLKVYRMPLAKVDPIVLAQEGEPTPFMRIHVEKANRFKPVTDWLLVNGPRQRVSAPAFEVQVMRDPATETLAKRYQVSTAADLALYDKTIQVYKLAAEQADALIETITDKPRGRSGGLTPVTGQVIPSL